MPKNFIATSAAASGGSQSNGKSRPEKDQGSVEPPPAKPLHRGRLAIRSRPRLSYPLVHDEDWIKERKGD